jgi:predicted nucleotide-binding protein
MAVPPLPTLLVSRAEAKEKIMAQIDQGLAITHALEAALSGFGFAQDTAFVKAGVEQEKWAKFTLDLLKYLFADLPIGREFGSWEVSYSGVKSDWPRQLLKRMIEWLHSLESIIERLDLFPLAGKPIEATAAPTRPKQQSKDIFIVHGHDDAAKHEVARVIEKLGLHPVILHEQADRGRTVIEKFEAHADVGFAVVLLTPDDMGYPKDKPSEAQPRARQNVVLELGYFSGILGRASVCALLKGDIEIPSDYAGVIYTPMDAPGAWKVTLAREIKAAGIDVDLNKLS